jgi:hypothetical protein
MVLRGTEGIIWPGWNDSAAHTLIFIAKLLFDAQWFSDGSRLNISNSGKTRMRDQQNNFKVHVLRRCALLANDVRKDSWIH